jgi:hypothetical protein
MKNELNLPQKGVVIVALCVSQQINANTLPNCRYGDHTRLQSWEHDSYFPETTMSFSRIASANINLTGNATSGSINASLRQEFDMLADRWEQDTAIYSSPAGMYFNKDYMCIIAKGMENPKIVVPLILDRLSTKGGDWFFALEQITGENPANDCQNYESAVIAWGEWAKQHGLIEEANAVHAA